MNASNEVRSESTPAEVARNKAYKQAGEDLWLRHGAERGVWSLKMLRTLERGVKGGKWFSLIDKVYHPRTLQQSWEKVESNAGACGVDGITIARFSKDSQNRLLAVEEHLKSGSYKPNAVKRVWIAKPASKQKRPLGIPSVRDRVVQEAIRLVIEPIYEKRFAASSYGFRPGRSCHDALARVDGQLAEGYTHVVDIDIQGYFDAINHERLMKLLEEDISDGKLLELIERFLKAGVLEDGKYEANETGTPQGGVISPLLSNLYLDELDHLMTREGHQMTRYADDMVVLCKSPEEAERALEKVRNWMEEVKLTLHPEKTCIVNMNEYDAYFDFLGYRFKRTRKGRIIKLTRSKSESKLKDKIRSKTRRKQKHGMKEVINQLNPILRGWYGYYKYVIPNQRQKLDSWIRMRLRSIYRKQHRKRGRGRGSDHQKWPNRHFEELGLFSLGQVHDETLSLC